MRCGRCKKEGIQAPVQVLTSSAFHPKALIDVSTPGRSSDFPAFPGNLPIRQLADSGLL